MAVEEFIEEGFSFNVENAKQMTVENNALTFSNTVYQISNISRVTVRKWKRVKRNFYSPFFILILMVIGIALTLYLPGPRAKIISLLIFIVGLFLYIDESIRSPTYIYLLVIELNSGSVTGFKSERPDFLETVVNALYLIIENPQNDAGFIINFSDNSIRPVYDYSVYIGGDLLNGIINSGSIQNMNSN